MLRPQLEICFLYIHIVEQLSLTIDTRMQNGAHFGEMVLSNVL